MRRASLVPNVPSLRSSARRLATFLVPDRVSLPPARRAAILSSGVVGAAVRLLRRLGPPSGPRGGRPAPSGGPWEEAEFNAEAARPPQAQAQPEAQPPGEQQPNERELYFGLRRDLVALVGNLCHGRAQAVEAVAAEDGVPVILQQCRGEEGARVLFVSPVRFRGRLRVRLRRRAGMRPLRVLRTNETAHIIGDVCSSAGDSFLREWALWAVRNMCEVSDAARDSIRRATASHPRPLGTTARKQRRAPMSPPTSALSHARSALQPVGVQKRSDDLSRMGLEVEWDAELGRPVLRRAASAANGTGAGAGAGGGGGGGTQRPSSS